ncbi:MAG TPA: ABC transporter permease [Candidatus Dormibacteraeota bacterium]|nr:ABC transporter permease [Candidatus Dormibacteraeota bacterium]
MSQSIAASRLLPSDLLRVGSLGLRSRRLRAALSGLGIAIGIACVVGVLGISASSEADLLAQLGRLSNLLTITPGQTLFGENAELPAASTNMIHRIATVSQASPVGSVSATVRRTDRIPSEITGGISVYAARPDLLSVFGGSVREGVFLNDASVNYPAAVLGSVAAQRLGIDRLDTPIRIDIGGHWFTVVGILNDVPGAPEIDRSVLIGFPIAESLFNYDGAPSTIYVRTDPSAVDATRNLLASTANPSHPEEVQVSRPSDALAAQAAAKGAFNALFLGLGAVALLVGGVGIANVMVISVLERRSEIGLRRALGATRAHIGVQFLTESILLSACGGIAGIVLGALITAAYAAGQGWTIVVPAVAIGGGIAAATLTGAVAGLYPALRAARLAPTEALRTA